MSQVKLADTDRAQLERRGISPEELQRQFATFSSPPPFARLVRPCGAGDGIRVLSESEHSLFVETWHEAAQRGRFSKFVPASGAASRMFRSLSAFGDLPPGAMSGPASGRSETVRDLVAFQDNLARLPFVPASETERRNGPHSESELRALVRTLLEGDSGLASRPKALIPFHRSGSTVRTPFEEHLVEGTATVADAEGTCRIHFTVSPGHEEGFRTLLERCRSRVEEPSGSRLEVSFSLQHPSTDTIAVDLEDRPFRLSDGSLCFRPAGHGALLKNLSDLQGDLVYVKNIDNVVPESRNREVLLWKRLLGGILVSLEGKIRTWLRALETPGCPGSVLGEAAHFAEVSLGLPVPPAGSHEGLCRGLKRQLDRPIRVCGVVRNTGEPGGGPFWVEDSSGRISPQIVESAQVDLHDPEQARIWSTSTHFNPVDLVLSLRDHTGAPYDLARFVDHSTALISRKSAEGRDLKSLERPGLWNGAMAGWNTLFVEVPSSTFAPVKSFLDLLRPEHQP